MLENYTRDLLEHEIMIVGFGIEGKSTYRFIRTLFPNKVIGICDANSQGVKDYFAENNDENIELFLGENYLKGEFDCYTMAFKTPGIPIDALEHLQGKIEITSQFDWFFKYFRHRVIGITGTKGKSTCASLLYEILKGQNINAALAGNIGIPAFDVILEEEDYTWYVCEMSSHQLESLHYSPHISLFLNVYQDHLDYYKTVERYVKAKRKIYEYHGEEDYLIVNKDIELESNILSTIIKMDFNLIGDEVVYKNAKGDEVGIRLEDIHLKGRHNLFNIAYCLEVCKLLSVENLRGLKKSISEFKGLAHRMEYVGEYGGIDFYNDSIATIPEATIRATEALKDVNTLIIGGYDRHIDYTPLVEFLSCHAVSNVICMPDSGYRIYDCVVGRIGEGHGLIKVSDLDEAIVKAFEVTEKGKACLFSPAAASYGVYKNFVERGNIFKDKVKKF